MREEIWLSSIQGKSNVSCKSKRPIHNIHLSFELKEKYSDYNKREERDSKTFHGIGLRKRLICSLFIHESLLFGHSHTKKAQSIRNKLLVNG